MNKNLTHILTVSLESGKRYKAYGVYDGSKLAITHCIPITGSPSKWKSEVLKEIRNKSDAGFIVLVEDRTEVFCVSDASPFSFEDMSEGRSMLFHALDWYFAMLDMGQLIADPEVERFLIRGGAEGQKIEKLQDEKGRTVYKVDWAGINGGVKAVLMCVAGAMMQPLSDRFLEAMYGPIDDDEDQGFNHEKSWLAITKGVDESRSKKWDDYYNA